jgi:hypothetical protein
MVTTQQVSRTWVLTDLGDDEVHGVLREDLTVIQGLCIKSESNNATVPQ